MLLVDRFLDPYVQAKCQDAKNGQKKTEFKQERNDRPKSVFEKFLKNFPQAMYARKNRIVLVLDPYVRGKITQKFTFST